MIPDCCVTRQLMSLYLWLCLLCSRVWTYMFRVLLYTLTCSLIIFLKILMTWNPTHYHLYFVVPSSCIIEFPWEIAFIRINRSSACPINMWGADLVGHHPAGTPFTGIRTWISNYIYCFIWDVITHSCTFFTINLTPSWLNRRFN